jgi:hypothetical protein
MDRARLLRLGRSKPAAAFPLKTNLGFAGTEEIDAHAERSSNDGSNTKTEFT